MGSDGPWRSGGADGPSCAPEQALAPAHLDLTRPDAYGRSFDDVYDRWYGSHETSGDDLDAMVRFVTDRCPSRVLIELGAGSGRLAVPLHRTGLRVIGIDASRSMLRRCPPSILRVAADMTRLPLGTAASPTFLCGFNTLFNVGSSDGLEQLLADIGAMRATFIVEMLNIGVLPTEPVQSTDRAPLPIDDGIVVSSTSADVPNRRLVGRHLEISDGGVVSRPWLLRLVGHDELDERAAKHGLRNIERYRSWDREPFRTGDTASISVYAPDPPGGGAY